MIQSIIVYGALGLLLWALGRISYQREKAARANGRSARFLEWQIAISMLLFAFISGVRWEVGVDHLSYLSVYVDAVRGVAPEVFDSEPGFFYLTTVLADFGVHFAVYFGLIALLQIYFFYRSFNLERHLLPYLGLVLVMGSQYLDWMNGMRQALAATIFVFSTRYIFEKKPMHYMATIFMASLFHKSALMLLPFYFIGRVDLFSSRAMSYVLLIACVVIGNSADWLSSNELLVRVLHLLGYEQYVANFENILSEYQQQTAFGPRRLSILFLWLILIFYSTRLKEFFSDSRIIIFYNLGMIGILYYNLFASAGYIILRPLYYFSIFLPVMVAYLLSFLRSNREMREFDIRQWGILALACSYTLIAVAADIDAQGPNYSAYKFYWQFWMPDQ